MVIGVPRETHRHEHRVGLTPFAAAHLVRQGHTVVVEKGAGESAHFTDRDYEEAGGQVVYGTEEATMRADVVCRVGLITPEELDLIRPGSVICAFHHLAVAARETVDRLSELEVTLLGYELVRDAHGDHPVRSPFSEMAGQMAVQIAAHHLTNEAGGRGILIGNVPGVPPPTIVILGAGVVGTAAARQAVARGAHVIVLDDDVAKLGLLHKHLAGNVVTVLAAEERLDKYTQIADVLIGAVLIPGARAPYLVSEEMVRAMKPGTVIIDASIDQGGCIETSRPTSLGDPTFVSHGVVHYCVPNMTANIARTASRALANACLPYIEALAGQGLEDALRSDPGLAEAVYLYRGNMVNARVGEALGIDAVPLARAMGEGSPS